MSNLPNRTSEWVAIQANPTSGAGPQRELLNQLVDSLRAHQLRPLVFRKREKLSKLLQNKELQQNLRCIVAAGGDGTVGDVLNRYPNQRIAVLPMGTENLLAKYLGIPQSGRKVAQIIAEGKLRTLDLAMLRERRFVLMASIGFDAAVIHRMSEIRTGHVRRSSYVKPIWQSLRRYKYPEIRLRLDDDETPYPAKLAMVVNLNAYALGIQPAQSAVDDDGLLDLRLFERGSAFQMLRYFYKVICGSHENLADVKSLRAKRIRIDADVPVPIQVDGDPAGVTPTEIRVLPGACEIFVPSCE